MEILFSEKNYTMSPAIIENKPPRVITGMKNVNIIDAESNLKRRTKFSYAIVDMLQIKPSTKLMLLQVCYKRVYIYLYNI